MTLEDIYILFPLLLPLITAISSIFLKNYQKAGEAFSIVGSLLLFLLCAGFMFPFVLENGIVSTQIGGWTAPYGITLVIDMFSAIMLVVSSFSALLVNVYSLKNIAAKKKRFGFYAIFHLLILSVNGAFMAGDIFNLYVWFEVMLISSFVLLVLGNGREQLVATVKYTLLSFIASSFLLIGIGVIYGTCGSLNMADISLYFSEHRDQPLLIVASILFMLPFAIKAALFPLYFWLPASYHTPSISVIAIFSSLLTKVGVYALIRCFTLIFTVDIAYTHGILLVFAAFTMLSGVLGALSKGDMRRILSFHIISQIGYMILGLALYTPLAIAGAIFFMVHNILAKTNLFLITGVVEKIKGSSNLSDVSGLYSRFPLFSVIFLLVALSLAGLPPFSGFWAKLVLITAGFQEEQYFVIFIAIITSLLTLFSMMKIWVNSFWGKSGIDSEKNFIIQERELFSKETSLLLPVIIMTVATLFIGLVSEPLINYSSMAAEQLMNPSQYINVVLKEAN